MLEEAGNCGQPYFRLLFSWAKTTKNLLFMADSWEFIKIPLQMELFPFHSDKI